MEEFTLLLHCTSKAQADAVLECFEPCDDISGGIVPDGDFRRDWELLLDRDTGMDGYKDLAGDETASVTGLVDADPGAPFHAQFLILDDSYDGNLMADYTYQDGKLQIHTMETVESVLGECPECGEELEHEIELKDHHHGEVYTCPACGAEFSFEEISYSEETITDLEESKGSEDSSDDEDLLDELPDIW